jgi:hypothetical protein
VQSTFSISFRDPDRGRAVGFNLLGDGPRDAFDPRLRA